MALSVAARNYKGLRVANVTDGNTGHIVLARTLAECGLDLADIDLTLMPFPDMLIAFQNGALDAAFFVEPFITRGEEARLFVLTKSGGDAYPGQQGAVLLYAPQFIANRREVAQRFMVGYLQGVRTYTAATQRGVNRPEIIEILSRLTSIREPALLDRLVPVTLNPDGYINTSAFADDVAWWFDKRLHPDARRSHADRRPFVRGLRDRAPGPRPAALKGVIRAHGRGASGRLAILGRDENAVSQ